jgi:hypothetical protein
MRITKRKKLEREETGQRQLHHTIKRGEDRGSGMQSLNFLQQFCHGFGRDFTHEGNPTASKPVNKHKAKGRKGEREKSKENAKSNFAKGQMVLESVRRVWNRVTRR